MERYAKKHNVPIMQPDGIRFLTSYVKKNHCQSILEIGSAIGYSAIKMALVDPNIHITTIERDPLRYEEAIKNIKEFHLQNQISILLNDAFDVELNELFDLIFIDAAKSHILNFLKNLN